jgi:hypothetical protein
MARPACPVATYLILALIVVSTFASCRREQADAPPADASQAGQQMELTDAGRERARPEPAPGGPASLPLPALDPRDSAFAARRLEAAPVFPIDTRIGPLRLAGLPAQDLEAWQAAYEILASLAAGDTAVAAEARRSVSAVLDELGDALADGGPYSVRLTAPVEGFGTERLFLYRLLGPDVDVTGELVLETDGPGWYIADIQSGTGSRPDG